MAPRPRPSLDLDGLPALLRDLAEAHGVAVALRFAADFGGRELTIPVKATPNHAVAKSVGIDVLRWLIRHRQPYEKIDVPLGPVSSYRKMIEATRRLVDSGTGTSEIVRRLGVHTRTVRRHRAARRRRGDEPDLFG